MPKSFRTIDDKDAQAVHDRVLLARNILEAHNNVVQRGSLISSRTCGNDPLNIQIEVLGDGQTFWDLAVPMLRQPELDRLLQMLRIQHKRVESALDSALRSILEEFPKSPGKYLLATDFQ